MRSEPLEQCRKRLARPLNKAMREGIQLSEAITGDGAAIFRHACGLGLDWSYPSHAGPKENPAADPQATGLSEGIISATLGSRQLTSY